MNTPETGNGGRNRHDLDTELPEEIAGVLADALRPIEPDAPRARAIFSRTLEKIRSAGATQSAAPLSAQLPASSPAQPPDFVTIHASPAGWVELLPKVHAKLLYTEGTAQSYLVRLEPGARAPAHGHPDAEECIVLEGAVQYVGGALLRAGDFQAAPKGAQHTELVSESGALVYLRYSRPVSEYISL